MLCRAIYVLIIIQQINIHLGYEVGRETWLTAVGRKCDFRFVFYLNLSGNSLQYPVTGTDYNATWTHMHKHMKVILIYLYGHFVRFTFQTLYVSTVQTSTKLRHISSHSAVIYISVTGHPLLSALTRSWDLRHGSCMTNHNWVT